MGSEVHEEHVITVPAKEDGEIVLDAEGPVVRQVALQLVCAEKGILGIGREAPQGGSKQRGSWFAQSLRLSEEAARDGDPQGSGSELVQELPHVLELLRLPCPVLRFRLAHFG